MSVLKNGYFFKRNAIVNIMYKYIKNCFNSDCDV